MMTGLIQTSAYTQTPACTQTTTDEPDLRHDVFAILDRLNQEAKKINRLCQQAINASAINFYQKTQTKQQIEKNKNFLFFTPTLIASLSLLLLSSPEKLKDVFKKILHLNQLFELDWHDHTKNWLRQFQNRSQNSTSSLLKTSKIGFNFQQRNFIALSKQSKSITQDPYILNHYYDATETFLFNDFEEAKDAINQAIAKNTENSEEKIENFVKEVNPNIDLLVAGLSIFRCSWSYPFEQKNTSIESFYNADGTKVHVRMMKQECDYLRLASDCEFNIQILELSLDGEMAFWLVNPLGSIKESKETLKSYMTEQTISQLINTRELRFSKINNLSVHIPKLDFHDKAAEINPLLREGLSEMGFSGSFALSFQVVRTPETILLPKTTSINEKKIEPASDSYFSFCHSNFNLDHSFSLILVDYKTNTILGMGQVLDMIEKKDAEK